MARTRRRNALWAASSAGLFIFLLHIVSAQRPQSISDTGGGGGGTTRQQQRLQLLLQQQQLQLQQQQQQRGAFRQRSRTAVVTDSARQRGFVPSPTRRPSSSVSSLFNPAQRRQNNPLFRNRQRVNFLRPKTAPPPLITRPPPPPRPTQQTTTTRPEAAPSAPPPPPPSPPETTFAYEEGVAYARGENPTLVTLGKHDPSEDYSEAVDELDDQERDTSFLTLIFRYSVELPLDADLTSTSWNKSNCI